MRLITIFSLVAWAWAFSAVGAQVHLNGREGSGSFGRAVTVLSNGNFIVTDPNYDAPGPMADVGAVYLYDGVTLEAISVLTGSHAGDLVGLGGVQVLPNGSFVVKSWKWNGDRGALTWCSGTQGVNGIVSENNSLLGGTPFDRVGIIVTVLANGNYVSSASGWDDGTRRDVGAATWGDGTSGVRGFVSAANSLIGGKTGDQVGNNGIVALPNGNYVVASWYWDNGALVDVGAVTWGPGTSGIAGVVSGANSLIGAVAGDSVGSGRITILTNGSYVVSSPYWSGRRGAITWANAAQPLIGIVSAANSLVGTSALDLVGSDYFDGVVPLSNGHYVVSSSGWDNSNARDAGAVTFCRGDVPTTGPVSINNSLYGTKTGDNVGEEVTALANGNFVVASPSWDNGIVTNVGAVTWVSGTGGMIGPISPGNSLIGTRTGDRVGGEGSYAVTSLANGNYVIRSWAWDAGRGAVTWANGLTGIRGVVSSENSLVGSTPGDRVGAVWPLKNGHYVVASPDWDNGPVADVGAATWCNGLGGTVGPINALNSLIGRQPSDRVGGNGIAILPTGHYVVSSPFWNNGSILEAGAVTWANGTSGRTGLISAANSLIGGSAGDSVGDVTVLASGDYVVGSRQWKNGGAEDAGAITWCPGESGLTGLVSTANSLVGEAFADRLGSFWDDEGFSDYAVTALRDSRYVIHSGSWTHGINQEVGAFTLGDGWNARQGAINDQNSIVGSTQGGLYHATYDYDYSSDRLFVGQASANRVSIFARAQPIRFRKQVPPLRVVDAWRPMMLEESPGQRFAAYVATAGSFDPALSLVDLSTARLLPSSNALASDEPGQYLLLLTNLGPGQFEVQMRRRPDGVAAPYEIGLYPLIRSGLVATGELSSSSRRLPHLAGSSGGEDGWANEYLVENVGPGYWLDVRLSSSEFVPSLEALDLRSEEVLWSDGPSSSPARIQPRLDLGRSIVIRAASRTPGAVGKYALEVRSLLPLGYRIAGRFPPPLPTELGPAQRVELVVGLRDDESASAERAVFVQRISGNWAPRATVLAADAGTVVSSGNLREFADGLALVLFTNELANSYAVELADPVPGRVGDYQAALYRVVRPGQRIAAALTSMDPASSNRTAAVGSGRWHYDDYLLLGVQSEEQVEVSVHHAEFSPFLEVRLLADDSVQAYRENSRLVFRAQGTGLQTRDYVIRVTSGASGTLGAYELYVGRGGTDPVVWSFSPSSGLPGTWVTVRGTNFLDGANPSISEVAFGVWPAAITVPTGQSGWHEFAAQVPAEATSGPIRVAAGSRVGVSSNDFVVLAPVNGARRELGGQISFVTTNVGGSVQLVVESTLSLEPPIRWESVMTNTLSGATSWRSTNSARDQQQFFRVRRN